MPTELAAVDATINSDQLQSHAARCTRLVEASKTKPSRRNSDSWREIIAIWQIGRSPVRREAGRKLLSISEAKHETAIAIGSLFALLTTALFIGYGVQADQRRSSISHRHTRVINDLPNVLHPRCSSALKF